jgi:hemolysin III
MSLQPPRGEALLGRPRLRGWLHQVAFVFAVPAAAGLILIARGPKARIAAAIYGVGVCALYGVSASYHRGRWSDDGRRRMKRLDHGTIFLMIAATYTPLCLLLLGDGLGTGLLIGVWIAAAAGMLLAVTGIAERRYVGFICYLGLGWAAVLSVPTLLHSSSFDMAMFFTGGLAYTVGAVVLAWGRPNPYPATFGYHEVWHSLVIAASTCHYLLILSLLRSG